MPVTGPLSRSGQRWEWDSTLLSPAFAEDGRGCESSSHGAALDYGVIRPGSFPQCGRGGTRPIRADTRAALATTHFPA
jgi:hypothetical protein